MSGAADNKVRGTIGPTAQVKNTRSLPTDSSVSASELSGLESSSQDSPKPKSQAELEKGTEQRPLLRPREQQSLPVYRALGALGLILLVLVIALPIVLTRHHFFTPHHSACPAPYHYQDRPNAPSYHIAENSPIYAVHDFPDPGLLHYNGTWYAYGTNPRTSDPNTVHVQVATSSNFVNWTRHQGYDALPNVGGWEWRVNNWAPDVIQRVCNRNLNTWLN